MSRKHSVSKLHQNIIDVLHDHEYHYPDCVAAFYRDGKVRLFSRDATEANEVSESGAQVIKKRYDDVTANAQAKSGLAVSKVNPWTFVYTIDGITYEITIP